MVTGREPFRLRFALNLLRYADQGLSALAILSINILAPLLVESEIAVHVLYLASWSVLGGAVSSALFGIPLIAGYSAEKKWLVREVVLVYLFFSLCFLVILCLGGLYFSGFNNKNVMFISFIFVWGGVDLARKSLLVEGKVYGAFVVSLLSTFSIFVGLYFLWLSGDDSVLWGVGAFGSGLLLAVVFMYLILRVGNESRRGLAMMYQHAKSIFANGSSSLLSFVLAWVATQGVFIFFFEALEPASFVEQKWVFSLLGVFGVLMTVQENKYQPLYASAIQSENYVVMNKYDKSISVENLIFFIVSVSLVVSIYLYDADIYLLAAFMMLVYRQAFGSAKKAVYFLRVVGCYRQIMLMNLCSCAVCYLVVFLFINHSSYAVSYGFAAYGVMFYLLSFALRRSKEKKIVSNRYS